MSAEQLLRELDAAAQPNHAEKLQRFFKTGPGQYAENDIFIGLTVPETRKISRNHETLTNTELMKVIASPIHEHRLAALIIMVRQYNLAEKAHDLNTLNRLHQNYLQAVYQGNVNNWDLVDLSAEHLIGKHLLNNHAPADPLIDSLYASEQLWERRVGILTTFAFIKAGQPKSLLLRAPRLFNDQEDLIRKAQGWMLREIGKRCGREVLTNYLDQYAAAMPRTTLSYATEHLSLSERLHYRSLKL